MARLEGWCAIRLPLLLICDEWGEAQLAGPGVTLTGFRDASQQEVPTHKERVKNPVARGRIPAKICRASTPERGKSFGIITMVSWCAGKPGRRLEDSIAPTPTA